MQNGRNAYQINIYRSLPFTLNKGSHSCIVYDEIKSTKNISSLSKSICNENLLLLWQNVLLLCTFLEQILQIAKYYTTWLILLGNKSLMQERNAFIKGYLQDLVLLWHRIWWTMLNQCRIACSVPFVSPTPHQSLHRLWTPTVIRQQTA